MNSVVFSKICDCELLNKQLINAGFAVTAVVVTPQKTTIYLDDGENKDPTAIVEAHIVKGDGPPLKERIATAEEDILTAMEAITEVYEQLLTGVV